MLTDNVQVVQRFDFSQINRNVKKTPQGFLRIPAFLTRTGIFEYVRSDGSVIREYRPSEEVFKIDSLQTFSGAPVTDLHPEINGEPVAVDPTNAKRLQVGFVGETIKQDGEFVSATLTITDQAMIQAIERGERKEISNGYSCSIEQTPGEYKGQRYDCIQRNIIGNHVAIGPRDWGRAGPQVSLRLDSQDAYLKSIHTENSMQGEQDSKLEHADVKQDTKPVEHFERTIADLQARLDAAQTEIEALKQSKEDAAKEASALAKLMHQSMNVLGADFDFASLHCDDIKKLVVQKLNPKISIEGQSTAYVDGCFDILMLKADASEDPDGPEEEDEEALLPEPNVKTDALAKANAAAIHPTLEPQKTDAMVKMLEWKKNAWKEKLAVNKENLNF